MLGNSSEILGGGGARPAGLGMGLNCVGLGWGGFDGSMLDYIGLGWIGLGWVGLGWIELDWKKRNKRIEGYSAELN